MRYKYGKYNIVEVETDESVCDGCCFERSVFGRDCGNVSRPECHHLGRKDGMSVIFSLAGREPVKRSKNKKNSKDDNIKD
jgi:hypothetical protein